MVTASHNPEIDNGIKIVDPDGGMMSLDWEQVLFLIASHRVRLREWRGRETLRRWAFWSCLFPGSDFTHPLQRNNLAFPEITLLSNPRIQTPHKITPISVTFSGSQKRDKDVEPFPFFFLQAFVPFRAEKCPFANRPATLLLEHDQSDCLEQRSALGSGCARSDLRLSDEEGICAEQRSRTRFARILLTE